MIKIKHLRSVIFIFLLCVPGVLAAQQQPAARVVVHTVSKGSLAPSTEITGTLFFDRTSKVSSEVAGRIQTLDFTTGDRLDAGDVIAILDQDLIDTRIQQLQAQTGSIEAQLEQARRDSQRFAQLHSEGAASTRNYEELLFRAQALEHDLNALRAQLKQAKIEKDKSTISTPFPALVLSKDMDLGAWVNPGTSIARLGSLEDIYVRVPLHEELYPFNQPGQKISLEQNATKQEVSGIIQGISGQADLQTKNLELRIHLCDPPALLAENVSFTCRVATGPATQLLLVPRDAIITFQGQKLAYTIIEGKAVPAPLQIVTYNGKFAGANSPVLKAGMPVVIDGNERLRPDQPVQIVKE